MNLTLRNPHSVLAVLEKRPKDVLDITLSPKATTETWEKVAAFARSKGIRVTQSARGSERGVGGGHGGGGRQGGGGHGGARAGGGNPQRGGGAPRLDGRPDAGLGAVRIGTGPRNEEEGGRVGGAEATVRERESIPAEELFRGARDRAQGKGLWLALDCLTDPHNVGAIFRAAGFFGVQGILLTQERSAPLTSTVYDVACGGLEYVPFTLQTNLQRGFEIAKEAGLWILGTSEHAKDGLASIAIDRAWLAVLGNEEKGMRRLTEENCDVLCGIPARGGVTSLNVSVAAGILIGKLTGAMT